MSKEIVSKEVYIIEVTRYDEKEDIVVRMTNPENKGSKIVIGGKLANDFLGLFGGFLKILRKDVA